MEQRRLWFAIMVCQRDAEYGVWVLAASKKESKKGKKQSVVARFEQIMLSFGRKTCTDDCPQ